MGRACQFLMFTTDPTMYRILPVTPLLFSLVYAAALQGPRDELAISPTPALPGFPSNTPTITSTTATSTTTPLHLPVTPESPDILGIADVSGFYGPGTWAGWFITILAAWWRIIRVSHEKFDPNTWLFLLCTNWAAVDLWRGLFAVRHFSRNSLTFEEDLNKKMGKLGAALNVTFWGAFHAALQFCVTNTRFKDPAIRVHRLRTLALGVILPLLALIASLSLPSTDNLPALYTQGKDLNDRWMTMNSVAISAIEALPIPLWLFHQIVKSELSIDIALFIRQVVSRRILWQMITLYLCVSIALIPVAFILALTKVDFWWVGLLPFFSCAVHVWITLPPFYLEWMAIGHICDAYIFRSSKASESCFFMPCAPQTMKDEDQLFALFAAVFAFVMCEILPVVLEQLKKRFRDREELMKMLKGE